MVSSTPSTRATPSPPEGPSRAGGTGEQGPAAGDGGTAAPRLRLLVINWQDRLNPQAGGAEVHLHEIFSRIASRGHHVTLLVSGWPEAPPRETVDGMEVVRAGTRHTFPLAAVGAVRRRLRDRSFDLVVEDINKLPLLTPLWVGRPVVALVPHLFGTTAFREASFPVAATVWAAERALPRAYGEVPFQVISESTRKDLVRRGLGSARIQVIRPGVDHERFRPDPEVERFPDPTFVYVGRLKRYKGLDVLLEAMAGLVARRPDARLLVAGRGDDRGRLEAVARREGVEGHVEFPGYVSEERKVELLRRAWANLYPSPKEGWGLTNVEAAACGTPTVASDSPGLRESVRDGTSGFLVPHGDAAAWEARLEAIATDPEARERLSEGALRHAERFSWDRAARETERSLLGARQALAETRAGERTTEV